MATADPFSDILPEDRADPLMVGRAWLAEEPSGPAVFVVRDGAAVDITRHAPTIAHLLAADDPARLARTADGPTIGTVEELARNSMPASHDPGRPRLVAPIDLQPVKACGVTFARSLLERLIEERAKGRMDQAEALRESLMASIGGDLAEIVPGSAAAGRLKAALVEQGLWSQYLEVGLGRDVEIFSKAQAMSAVGHGAAIGLRPDSAWNNPEPEVVLVLDPRGRIVGATLGNDVNLRDVEGRSALLLGRAKDNNASCAIGPLIRLFDDGFGPDAVRAAEVRLTVVGEDGFRLEEVSSMAEISRDIDELARQLFDCHQYPDGVVLMTGTMFAPIQDRDRPGEGFTHKTGDVVVIEADRLGRLANTVTTADRAPPWSFGALALMRNLAGRGLL